MTLNLNKTKWLTLPILCFLFGLVSCKESDEQVIENHIDNEPTQDENNESNVSTIPLLESYLKKGLEVKNATVIQRDTNLNSDTVMIESTSTSPANSNYSDTNVQEVGIDEADFVKHYDGYAFSYYDERVYYYLEASPAFADTSIENTSPYKQGIRVFDLNATSNDNNPIVEFPLADELGTVSGLYIHQGENPQLLLLADDWKQGIQLRGYDARLPMSNLIEKMNIHVPGRLLTSRKMDNKLYVVSSFMPIIHAQALDSFIQYPIDEEQKKQNEELIQKVTLKELLPNMNINGNEIPLIDHNSCQIPDDDIIADASLTLISIIDLNDITNISSACLAANSNTTYVSYDALYLSIDSAFYDINGLESEAFSDIYRFKLSDNGPIKAGKQRLNGRVGYNQPFRLSEYQEHLRVITTDNRLDHQLHTLKLTDTEMTRLASLPNAQNPEPIGKPGEDIFGVRFSQDRAYIVTFLCISDKGKFRTLFICEYLKQRITHYQSIQHVLLNKLGITSTPSTLWFLIDENNEAKPLNAKLTNQFIQQYWPENAVTPANEIDAYRFRHTVAQTALNHQDPPLTSQQIDKLMGHSKLGEHYGNDQLLPTHKQTLLSFLNNLPELFKLNNYK
ncbi:beta-propeller domain-containing protein [Photobacterium leiognathi]|uniref:beta-propeller domain-containing protein n=1 Tax=Photobacterium leiognathi TaxID=553611 RepID=UPI003DA04C43